MNSKIKILRIINRFNIGGPTYNATFLTAFISDKFETMLIGGPPEEGESDSLYIPEKYGVKPILIPELKRKPNLFLDRRALQKIISIINEFKPHIVHTHASKAGAIGRYAAEICKVPIIVHTFHGHVFHSYFGKIKTWLYKRIEKKLAKKSSAIIAISDIQKYELTKIYKISSPENTYVVPLGFDLKQFQKNLVENRKITRHKYDIKSNEIAIGIIGRLTAIKNHTFFIDAAKKVSDLTSKKIKFFIVGDGEERINLENYCKSAAPGVEFIFTSWIKEIAVFNPAMDIICLCSKNEGTPVSLIEAQACNIPVISTIVGGIQDIVLNNYTGLLSESNDLETFSKNMLDLIENEKKRIKMSQNGWTHVENKFGYKQLVYNTEKLYYDLINKSNQR